MQWIDVQEKLPEKNGIYLVISDGPWEQCHSFLSEYKSGHFLDWPPNCGCTGFDKVTHWMDLPMPPES
jgi:hypothetical protein